MRHLKLAYRDNDRTPVIFCIHEMAKRFYDLDVEVVQIQGTEAYEAALFDGSCDVIIEHLEYLFAGANDRLPVTLFCAPSISRGLKLVVDPRVRHLEELNGKTMAVRSAGRPHAVTLWIKNMGLESTVRTVIVKDSEVGRWGQWKKIVSGECSATFMDPIYLPPALGAGLKVLDVPDIEVVGHYAQACLSRLPNSNPDLFLAYLKSVIHAICMMKFQRDEALKIVSGEPMRLMKIEYPGELERQFESVTNGLQAKPYPTPAALFNSDEIAATEYGSKEVNPLTFWDLHWVKKLDDEGFIDSLIDQLRS